MCGLAREWIGQNASFGERSQIIKREFLSGPKRTALTCGFESLVWSPVFSSLVSREDLGRYEGTSEIKKKKRRCARNNKKYLQLQFGDAQTGPLKNKRLLVMQQQVGR